MLAKMKNGDGGSRIAIVMNGSSLFTGDAGSGESEIRRWIIENDWLEAIIALPNQLFYNTGINTYIWILTNFKKENRKGKVKLINAVVFKDLKRKVTKSDEERIEELLRKSNIPLKEEIDGLISLSTYSFIEVLYHIG